MTGWFGTQTKITAAATDMYKSIILLFHRKNERRRNRFTKKNPFFSLSILFNNPVNVRDIDIMSNEKRRELNKKENQKEYTNTNFLYGFFFSCLFFFFIQLATKYQKQSECYTIDFVKNHIK